MKLLLFLATLALGLTPSLLAEVASEQPIEDTSPAEDATDEKADNEATDWTDEDGAGGDFIDVDDELGEIYDLTEPTIADTPLSIHLQFGRKWYQDVDFNLDMFEFITEWYLFENLPIKLGPTLSYQKLTQPGSGIAGGQILELGLRGSFFWDFGRWSPYVALRYTMLSSGSVDIQHEHEGDAQKGTVDLKIRGFDLTVGAQVRIVKQIYLTLESSLANEEQVEISGKVASITRDNNTDEIEREVVEVSSKTKTKFNSLSMGVLFEL